MGLTRTAITRPVFILMLMLAAFFVGTVSYRSMRLELNPDVSFGVITVTTVYPGAGPEEINNLVSRKIEEAISGVNGIREVTSTSREGVSNVVASFEIGVDQNTALNDLRSKVDSVTGELPRDVEKPTVSKIDNAAQPVLYLAFAAKNMNSRDLRDLIDNQLRDKFSQIQGVASADVQGGDVREIQVQVKRDKLMQYGIGILDVQRAVSAATLNAPSGKLESGSQEFSVRLKGEFENVDELKNLLFTVNDPRNPQAKGKIVRLSDVADIKDTVAERTSLARLNGNETIVLAIQKTKEGNAVDITKQADVVIGQIEKDYKAEGIHITKTLESAKQITESLDDLRFALFFGIFLVAIIVYVFLHNFRGMLIVSFAIPTSIFATFIALKAMGFTVNNMSMLALSLAIGVLVDDAIVVLENIYRHLKMGEDPREAALNGRSEIGLAAIAITLADVVVFLPIGFMGGIVGQFFKPMALGFVAATLFSLFVSFTLTPMLAARWYRRGEDLEHPTGRFATWFERNFARLERGYRHALEWALNHRWFVFILGNAALFAVFMFIGGSFAAQGAAEAKKPWIPAALAAGSMFFFVSIALGIITTIVNSLRGRFSLKYITAGVLFGLIFPFASLLGGAFGMWKGDAVFKFSFLPTTDAGTVNIQIELPPGSNLEATQAVAEQIENKVQDDPDVKYYLTNIGSQGAGGGFGVPNTGSNYGQVLVTLNDKKSFLDNIKPSHEKLRTRSSTAIAADMLQEIGRIPGADVKVSAGDQFGFGSPIQMSFRGDDRDAILKSVRRVVEGLREGKIKGVINPDISSKPGKPEIVAFPDRARLADAGVDLATVGSSLRTLYQGDDTTKFRQNGHEYDIRVMLNREDRDNPNKVAQVPIKFVNGNPIMLGSVTSEDRQPALDKIDRRDRQEEIRVTADLLPGFAAGSVQGQITTWINQNNLVEPGVTFKPLGQADAQSREGGYMLFAFVTGLLLVYMLLASLYDNLLYPFIIQLAQPQAMVGALLALVLTDKTFSLVGFIGVVALIGLVGKNAILLVDYTNTLRERGRSRHDALAEAGPVRLRPIMMTTLALIFGMLPVALAIGRGSEFRETIGITIIGGISLSTLLTLFVIPCSYTIFDDLSLQIGSLMKRITGRHGQDEIPAEPLTQGTTESDAKPVGL